MDGYVTIGTKLDTADFDAEIRYVESQLEEIEYKLKQADMGLEVGDTTKLEAEYSKLSRKLSELVKKQKDLNTTDYSNLKNSIDNVGESVTNTIKKVGRWTLAIFGVRSAYMMVRQAMNTISQYDTQMASNIEYIRYALAMSLKPIIETIINLVVKLLQYINYIAQAWFGVNLFANASSKGFKKAKDGLSGANKQAKELKKTLAGFDEMNILQDTQTKDSGAGASGIDVPPFDLSKMQGKVPKWLKWIADNRDLILSTLAAIAGMLVAIKLGADLLTGLGIGVVIFGIVYAIIALIDYLKNPTFENFGKIITGIGIAVIGLGVAFFGLPAIVAGVFVAILGIVITHWDKIKEVFDNVIKWLSEKANEVEKNFGFFAGLIVKAVRDQVKLIRDTLDTIFTKMKDILNNIIAFFKNVFAGNWKEAWNNVVNIGTKIFEIWVERIKFTFGTIKNIIVGTFGVIGDIIGGILKGAINLVFTFIENRINNAITLFNGVLSAVNMLPGVSINTIPKVKLPRLAKGGIINMPGRGIPVGGAIAGEKGQEGIIPLTDSQQMALLGEAIGKYITINANITNTMNGRVISRELQKVQNTNDFAFNR